MRDAGDLVQVGTGKDYCVASFGTIEVGTVFRKPEVPTVGVDACDGQPGAVELGAPGLAGRTGEVALEGHGEFGARGGRRGGARAGLPAATVAPPPGPAAGRQHPRRPRGAERQESAATRAADRPTTQEPPPPQGFLEWS